MRSEQYDILCLELLQRRAQIQAWRPRRVGEQQVFAQESTANATILAEADARQRQMQNLAYAAVELGQGEHRSALQHLDSKRRRSHAEIR